MPGARPDLPFWRTRATPLSLREVHSEEIADLALEMLLAHDADGKSSDWGSAGFPGRGDNPSQKVLALSAPIAPKDSLEMLALWRQFLGTGHAAATVRVYWDTLFNFFKHVPVPPADITEDHVTGYLSTFPYRSNSKRTYYQAIRAFFRWAYRRGFVREDPTAELSIESVMERIPQALTSDELYRVGYAAGLRHPMRGLTVAFLYFTGMRVGEAVAVGWRGVHDGQLTVPGFKGGRERPVPIRTGLRGTLEGLSEYRVDARILPRTKMTVWKWLKDAGLDAGVAGVHPHLIRATTATVMLERGVDVDTVRRYLGHINLKTTQRYLAARGGTLRKAADVL